MRSWGWDPQNGISTFMRRDRELAHAPFLLHSPSLPIFLTPSLFSLFLLPCPLPHHMGKQWKDSHLQARKSSHQKPLSCWPWTSSLHNYEIINAFCFKQIILLWQTCYGLRWWLSGSESACRCRSPRLDPWVGKIAWRRKWQPTPVFLPGKSCGQRSLVVCSSWGHKRVGHDLGSKQQS